KALRPGPDVLAAGPRLPADRREIAARGVDERAEGGTEAGRNAGVRGAHRGPVGSPGARGARDEQRDSDRRSGPAHQCPTGAFSDVQTGDFAASGRAAGSSNDGGTWASYCRSVTAIVDRLLACTSSMVIRRTVGTPWTIDTPSKCSTF